MTLFDQFKRNRDERPDAPAFLIAAGDRSVPITWREFARDIEAVAWIIRKYVPGATIALLGENSYEWITAHAACLFSGATVMPLEVNLSAEEIAERMSFTGARVLLHSAALAKRAREVRRLLPKLITGGFGTRATDRVIGIARKALAEGGLFDQPGQRDENDIAMLVFTSGTTSKPRGAELTIAGISTFCQYWQSLAKYKPGERTLMLLPLNHIFGISVTYTMLASGVAMGVCPDFRRIYEAVERFRAHFLFLVPALADLLADKIAQHARTAEEAGLSLKWILTGGAPMPGRTYSKLKALGIEPITGYGLTETTALYSVAELDNPHPGSAGRSCGGFGGMETRVSSEGILQIRGPAVLRGYYKEPEKTAAVLDSEGWFSTGDYGRIDDDGYVWITGRASRTIILSSGKKIAPEELEEKLLSIPGFLEVVVSGNLDTRDLQAEVYANVSEESVREQIAILNRKLALHKRIRRIVVRTEPFPRTASGKIKLDKPPAAPADCSAPFDGAVSDAQPVVAVQPAAVSVQPAVAAQPNGRLSPLLRALPALPPGAVDFCKKYTLPIVIAAGLVLLLNIAQIVIVYNHVAVPESLKAFFEGFESIFAIFILTIGIIVYRWHQRKGKKKQ